MTLEVLVTSGGTVVPIDDVRHIGNFSGGTTGALIAEEFLRQGAIVHYVYAKGSKRPYRRDLELNPDKDIESELERVSLKAAEYKSYHAGLYEYRVDSFHEYYGRVKELLTTRQIDAAVFAAAVSDYGVQKVEGKISSENEKLTLDLEKLPKVISEVKKWKPDVYLVGFKFLPDAPIDELVETAYCHGQKNHSDLTVANTAPGLSRKIVLVTPERDLYPVSQSLFPEVLVKMVMEGILRRDPVRAEIPNE
jgi:phosphopantothenate-cysteine ligase